VCDLETFGDDQTTVVRCGSIAASCRPRSLYPSETGLLFVFFGNFAPIARDVAREKSIGLSPRFSRAASAPGRDKLPGQTRLSFCVCRRKSS